MVRTVFGISSRPAIVTTGRHFLLTNCTVGGKTSSARVEVPSMPYESKSFLCGIYRRLVFVALLFGVAGPALPVVASGSEGSPRTPVFVVMGGYQTCPRSYEIVSLPVPSILDIASRAKRVGD